MRFLVSAIGSAGDVHPFIAISQVLLARGHGVQMLASPQFEARIRAAGIDFLPLGTAADYERMVQMPALWHPRRGTRLLLDELLDRLPDAYAAAVALSVPSDTVLVASSLSWNLLLLREVTGLRTATVHLSPLCLPSALAPSLAPGGPDLRRWPPWVVRSLHAVVERLVVDRRVAPRLNRFRSALGLPPVRRIWSRWMHSPDLVLGAWPDWFAPSQRDWPAQVRTTGFPLFSEAGAAMAPTLEDFLRAGAAPVGITPGSAMAHGHRFLGRAMHACQSLGLRSVLITPYADQLPAPLPADCLHQPYVPFGLLMPRLAAVIHHGGIGTGAQALAAGVPQLVLPFAHDQFDNAARLRCLGVAEVLGPASPDRHWQASLRRLATSPQVAGAVSLAARRMKEDARAEHLVADHLERLGAQPSN